MKVLFVGFFKTGTKTMNKALSILGYNVSDIARNHEFIDTWWKFYDGKGNLEDIKMMFEGYDASGDSPCFIFWKYFLEAYPDIKLILTTRNVEDWIRSWTNQVKEINNSDLRFPLSLFSRRAREYFEFGAAGACASLKLPRIRTSSVFGLSTFPLHSRKDLTEGFHRHMDDVMENAPQAQLLVYNVKEGWEPLCRFLGKDVPDVAFPHENKGGEIISWRLKNNEFMLKMYREMYFNLIVLVAVASIVIYWFLIM